MAFTTTTTPTPKPSNISSVCNFQINKDRCDIIENCYFDINTKCNDKNDTSLFTSLHDINLNNIKCVIYPDINTNTIKLDCINTNPHKNLIIQCILIDKLCVHKYPNNEYLYNNCNILLSNNIISNKIFELKKFTTTFDKIGGDLLFKPNITLEQIETIKFNNNKITLVDIYNNHRDFNVEIYTIKDSNIVKNTYFYNKNKESIFKIKQNISNIISNL